jgi:hypothetical protein
MSINAQKLSLVPAPPVSPLVAMVDEYAELYLRIGEDLKRYEKLKKQLAAFAAEQDPGQEAVLVGTQYLIEYTRPSAKDVCRATPQEFIEATHAWEALTVSAPKARDALPASLFMELFEAVLDSRRIKRVASL